MARNKDRNRSNLGENLDSPELERTNIERSDRTMGAGARTDNMAGAEGIEDPALERSRREDVESGESRSGRTSMSGSESRSGREGLSEEDRSSRSRSFRRSSQRSSQRSSSRQQGRESTDSQSRSFSGSSRQQEGSESPERGEQVE